MGGFVSRLFRWAEVEETRLVMLGLDGAGKTTTLYKLKIGEVIATTPTIGFNVETVEYKKLKFSVWDVGGQAKIRVLWHYYFEGSRGLIYIVDSADRARVDEAREELWSVMSSDALRDAPVLIFANKQDLPKAMKPSELAEALALPTLPRHKAWHVQACQASTGDGLYEGLDWLSASIKAKGAR